MPLYKITERRLKRKERDEEDGIAILKAALREEMGGGGDETDDEESDSDSDDDSESDEDGDSEDGGLEQEEDEVADGPDEDGDEDDEAGAEASDLDEEIEDEGELSDLDLGQSSDEEEVGPPPMSISEALTSPIYPGSKRHSKRRGPSSRCVLCPGKVFQFENPIADHLASAVHKRAVKRYQARLDSGKPIETDDPRELVASIFADLGNNLVREPKAKKAKGKKEKTDFSTKPTPSTSTPTPSAKAQKRLNKKERKAERAKALLERIGDKSTSDAPVELAETAAEEASGEPGLKLNRKARRLLAQKTKGGDSVAVDGAEKAVEDENGGKGDEQVAKKVKKNKKERMRKSQAAGPEVVLEEVSAEKVEKGEKKRKEKRQKKAE